MLRLSIQYDVIHSDSFKKYDTEVMCHGAKFNLFDYFNYCQLESDIHK